MYNFIQNFFSPREKFVPGPGFYIISQEKKVCKMCHILHRQVGEILLLSVYLYFVSLHEQTARFKEKGKCDIATSQDKATVSSGVRLCTAQRITSESNKCNAVLKSTCKNSRGITVTGMDDFETLYERLPLIYIKLGNFPKQKNLIKK